MDEIIQKFKDKRRKNFVLDGDTVSASFKSKPSIFDDLAEHSNEKIISDLFKVIDDKYNLEAKFLEDVDNYKATATCCDEDIYDEQKGIDIAAAKCDLKYHHNMSRRYKVYERILYFLLLKVERIESFHTKKEEKITNYLEKFQK